MYRANLNIDCVTVFMSSAAIAIQVYRPRHASRDELQFEKAVNSDRIKRRHVVCRDCNPSLPVAACAKRRIAFAEKAVVCDDRDPRAKWQRELHYTQFQGNYRANQ